MWPFSRKTVGLIDDRWLREKGIPTEYRDAFNRSKKDMKTEIQRNTDKVSRAESELDELEARIREGHVKMATLKEAKDELSKRDDAKSSQELQEKIAEMGVLQGIQDRLIADKARFTQTIDNANETVKMLQMVQNKSVSNPEQLTQSPIWGSGGQTADIIDELPSALDIDNTEFIDSPSDSEE
ncbi:MAG: hypothetical protein CMB66_02100 [Euryarchaeota archaeon]|nr:hypothetical protein [Euryarchaeota archaeon]|tara:strand:- start:301 stop:849 length:549 start_codon:yes stop_codon:yes gene_type:complete